jgi:phosphate transport system substrate-binding protein
MATRFAFRFPLAAVTVSAAIAVYAFSALATEHIVLTGSSTVAPLAMEIGKRYEELHPGVRVDVQTGGSSRGVHDAREGLATIGMVSRDLHDSERDLQKYTLAMDGITIIVNKKNPIATLTPQQIIDIYTGKIRDWSALGAGSGQIVVENKAEGRSTLELFLEHFKLAATAIRADVVVGDNEQAVKVVAGNPLAIGYVSVGTAVYEADNGTPIKPLPLEGVQPTVEAVANKKFPIVRELNFVVNRPPEGVVKDFIAFAQSKNVDDLITDLFFVPLQ